MIDVPHVDIIRDTVAVVLYNCLPILGISDSMQPIIRREMKKIVDSDPIFRRRVMNVEHVVLLLMLTSIKKLRLPCNKRKMINMLHAFNTIYHKKEMDSLLNDLDKWYI